MKSENHITLEQFAPLVYSFFALASVLSIITSQQKLPLVVMFILDSLIQPFLGLKGMTGGSDYWVVLRCVLKLISFPFYFKYTNSDLSWIFIDIHMLQIGPNFSKSYLTAHIFTVFNIMTHFVLSYCFLQRSFLFTFSLTFSFIYQYTLITCYKKLYTDKTKTLEQKVSEFESVWASIQSNVIKTDLNLNILLINKGFLGKSVEELTGFSFKKLSIFNEQKFDALKKEKKTQMYKIQINDVSKYYLYTVVTSPILIDNEMVGITILCTDSTCELQIKKKEIEHEKQLFALKSKTEFIASISHEIRNPLQALTFSIESLKCNEPRKDQIGILNEAQNSNQLINHIIGDILDSSKIETGNFQLQNKNFEILDSIESAMKINIPQAFKKSLDFTYSIDFQIPRILKGDNPRLIQIISNLMSNAIKYTNSGNIHLDVKQVLKSSQKYLRFSIKDTGIGIKKENLNKIFSMFEQVHDSTGKDSTGWGIGLSIVKGLINLMNGTYGVESEYGFGSTFWFEIPMIDSMNSLTIHDSLPISHFKTIILVLQDLDITKEMKNLFNGLQVNSIFVTKSSSQISEIYNKNPSDCKIFVDDDLIYQVPSSIPHEQVLVIGNSSKKDSEYNDCLRLFKPLLPSNVILELTPPATKKFSGDQFLLDGSTVLIVEDHVVIQKCMKRFVEKMSPKKVLVASNGAEALKYFELEKKIDLMLTDIQMPVLDGYDLIKAMKLTDHGKRTKTVVTTGEMNNPKVSTFMNQWRVDDILMKPITYSSLIASIKNLSVSK